MVIPRLEAPRVVAQDGAFTLRPWGETEDPTAVVADLARGAATAGVGDQMWARFLVELLPQLPGVELRRAVEVLGPLRMIKDAAEVEALRAAGAAADRVAASAARRRDPAGRPHRGAGLGRHLGPPAGGRPRQGQLRNRRRRRERRQPAPPRRPAGHHGGRDRAVRLRRHDGRLLQRHHALRVHRHADRRDRRGVRRPARGAAGQRGGGHHRHAVRGRRPGSPPDHRRRRVRRAVHPPHRPRHRHGGARRPLHRRGQPPSRSRPATPSASSPASMSPAGGGCAWRTSSSPRRSARSRSTRRITRSCRCDTASCRLESARSGGCQTTEQGQLVARSGTRRRRGRTRSS